MTSTRNSPGSSKLSRLFILWQILSQSGVTKIYFSAPWIGKMIFKIGKLVSWLKSSRASWFLSKIGTKSNGWTLCKVLRGVGGMLPRKSRSSNYWKCIEIVNSTTTTLFCIILNLLRSNQADLFGSWRVRAHPAHPPAYGPAYVLVVELVLVVKSKAL